MRIIYIWLITLTVLFAGMVGSFKEALDMRVQYFEAGLSDMKKSMNGELNEKIRNIENDIEIIKNHTHRYYDGKINNLILPKFISHDVHNP